MAVLALVFTSLQVGAQTYYSRGASGAALTWTSGLSWSTSAHNDPVGCLCTPPAGAPVVIGRSHVMTIPNNANISVGSVIVDDDASANVALIIGDNTNNAASLNLGAGSLTINTGGTFTIGGTSNANNSLTVGAINVSGTGIFNHGNTGNGTNTVTASGDLTISLAGTYRQNGDGGGTDNLLIAGSIANSNVFNMNNTADASTVTFTGSGQTLSGGGGTFTFSNLTMNTAGANNVAVNNDIRVNGQLSFNANGIMVVNASNNFTLGPTATTTGQTAARYIQLDESNGTNGQLIKVSNGTVATWQLLYPIGTNTNGYNPVDLSVAGGATMTTNPVNNSTLSIKAIINPSVQGQLRRTFRLTVAGNGNGTAFSLADFYYSVSDISTGDTQPNYSTGWYLSAATGTWTTVTGTAPGATFFTSPGTTQPLSTGTYYYTIGTSTAYPSTWYSYQSGNWSDYNIWTLDPSGTTLSNPLAQPPLPGDQVVIVNGFTVTVDVTSIVCSSTTIQGGGILDVAAFSPNLGTVSGSGKLRVNGVGLPSGTYNSFVLSTGGTVEYYDTGGNLPTGQTTYNNLILSNSTTFGVTFVTASSLTLNGDLNITNTGSGTVTWQINDGSNNQRTLTLNGNLVVSSGGLITVGTGNSGAATPHVVSILGDFTNNGTVKFYDPIDATYSAANYSAGNVYTTGLRGNTAAVTFSGLTSNTVTCNGVTDFYRLVLNKGTGQQATLTVNASAAGNFRLFGPANLGSNTGTAPNEISQNALSLQNGTLILTGSVSIPILCANGSSTNDYFSIPQNAGLWVNGASVSVTICNNSGSNDDQRLMLDGLLRVSAGTMFFGRTKGLGSGAAGLFLLEGGTVTAWQFRARQGGTGIFVYNQTGGTFNVGTTGYLTTVATSGINGSSDARFDLSATTSSFQMSGGTLNIGTPTAVGGNGINIQSSSSNYNVTGGTVNAYIPSSGSTFTINTTAPFYNFAVYREGTAASVTATLAAGLTVLNNLTLISANGPTLNCSAFGLTVGGNINDQAGTVLTPGNNTITINGSGPQTWTHDGTISNLYNLTISKTTGTSLVLGGAQAFPALLGASSTGLTLTSGTLNDGGKTITTQVGITNNATHTGSGAIVVNGPTTIAGTNGSFGNLTIQTNATVTTGGTQTVNGTLRLLGASTLLNIGSFGLSALGNVYSDAGTGVVFTTTKCIQTSGLHNAVGLTRQAASAQDLLFPVGTPAATTLYTPITINATASTPGTITVRPVTGAHPTTTGGNTVAFYWRVTSSGFVGLGTVIHKDYTYMNATRTGASNQYRPGRYDPNSFTWTFGPTYDATAGSGLTEIATTYTQTGPPPTISNAFSTNQSWSAAIGNLIDGEYTAGLSSAFGSVQVYYSSSTPGNWGNNASWSKTSVGHVADAGSTPSGNSPVVIGDASNNHTITINAASQSCGTLNIATGSTLDCGAFAGLSFGANTGGTVTGRGTLKIGGGVFPGGDFTNFLGSSGGTVEYTAAVTIPTTQATSPNLNLTNYYNLVVSAAAGTVTMPQTNLTIYNNFTKNGAGTMQTNLTTPPAGPRTLSIGGDFNINAGTFNFQNGLSYAITVTGNTTIAGLVNVPGSAASVHTWTTSGSITNNGQMFFRNSAHVVDITFTGTNATFLNGGGTNTTIDKITVNKGTTQAAVLTISASNLNALSNNWLTITNGTADFNNSSYNVTLTSTATNPFTIGTTAKLKVDNGIVNVSAINANDSDVLLNGAIEVTGGSLIVGNGNNNDNDIEYASAGTPSITVSGGSLSVNGAIRRSTNTLSGALVYSQSNGLVTAAGRHCNVAPNNTRGVFEIEDNIGSSFTMSGGTLTVSRPTGGSNFTDLFLNPTTTNVTGGTIQIGDNALGAQTLDVDVVPSIGAFTVLGAAGNAQTVNMVSSPLNVSGILTINAASILNTNSLDVSIGGNLAINTTGTYNGTIGSGNTTTFNGAGPQSGSLSATSTFSNMTVSKSSGTVTLSGNPATVTDLNILSGVLDVGALNLTVIGNITNNSTQQNTGGGSLSLAGGVTVTAQTITSSNGVFGNLALAGSATSKTVTVNGNTTINGTLTFSSTNRFLMIGSNLLTLGSASSISGAGASAFIRTNGVSSDLGVTKTWAVAGATLFTYPLGTLSNYTPIAVTLTVSAPGDLNIIPVNSRHPTYNVGSTERILNYYWILTRGSGLTYSATGSHVYSYPSALMGGTGGTLVAGYLDVSNPTGWVTGSAGSSATTTAMTFTNNLNTNMPTVGNTFHYSAGTSNTLPNPIVPVYSRLDDAGVAAPGTGGNWSSPSSWTTSFTGHGAAVGAAPIGVPVVILSGARINMNVNGRVAFTSQIDGVLVLGTSFGHNLGILKGGGTMRTSTNTFPAGNFTTFVSSSGGTIEYVAPMTMNNRSTYNNLTFSGTGTVVMTNTDLTLNGAMTIPVGVIVNNASNRSIAIARDWSNSGTFTQGTGTVSFNGTLAQGITGTTTFNNLTVAKSSNNLTLNGVTTVNGILNMSQGDIISTVYPAAPRLVLGSSATLSGGSATSFVDGGMSKVVNSAGSFVFPLGSVSANRYRPATIGSTSASDTWTLYYIGHNPATDGYNWQNHSASMAKVSFNEYWQVANSSGTTSASLTLSFGPGSYYGSDVGNLSMLKTARWDGSASQWDLPPGGGTFSQTGTNTAGTVTVSIQTQFSPQTLASDDPTSTLPIELMDFQVAMKGTAADLTWWTASEVNSDYFTIERSADLESFEALHQVKAQGTKPTRTNYEWVDETPLAGKSYYRLRNTDINGQFTFSQIRMIENNGVADVRIYPNPVTGNRFTMEALNFKPSEQVVLRIVNLQGLVVYEAAYQVDDSGNIKRTVEVGPFSDGLYAVIVISSSGVKKKVIFE